MFLQGKLYFTVRHCSKDLITRLNPHFTDVETDPQGISVACQVTQLVRPGWGWGQDVNPMVWLWSPSYWPAMSHCLSGLHSPRRGTTDNVVDFSGLSGAVPQDLCSPHPLEQMGKVCINRGGGELPLQAALQVVFLLALNWDVHHSPSLVVTYP